MFCVICKHGTTKPGLVTVTLQREDCTVILKGVPAEVCDNCGEYYLSDNVTEIVLERAERAISLKLKQDDTVICSIENGKIVLEPVPKTLEYTLDELLAGFIETSEEISWGKPEGEEVW